MGDRLGQGIVAGTEVGIAAVDGRDRVGRRRQRGDAPLVATPPTRVTALPKFVPSIWNCTVPVGVSEPGGLAATLAVKLTDWPKAEGLAVEVTAVVERYWETGCVKLLLLVVKLLSPL